MTVETTGRIKNVSRDWQTDKLIVSFEINSLPSDLDALTGCDALDITARRHRRKRSLNANAYFHLLTGKIAEAVGTSLTHEKNRLIREYGQYMEIDGLIPTTTAKSKYEDVMLDMDGVHLKAIARPDRETVRFAFMRGSHTYDTKEMSRLIDATVSEAKELGIETIPPKELERMKQLWTGKNC